MRIEYSPTINAIYVRLRDGEVADTVEVGDDVYADLDEAGEPIGVEFLDAAEFFPFLARHAPAPEGVAIVELPEGLAALVRDRMAVAT